MARAAEFERDIFEEAHEFLQQIQDEMLALGILGVIKTAAARPSRPEPATVAPGEPAPESTSKRKRRRAREPPEATPQ